MIGNSLKNLTAGLLIAGALLTFCSCLLFCGDSQCLDEARASHNDAFFIHQTETDSCPVNASAKAATAERVDLGDHTLLARTPFSPSFLPKRRMSSVAKINFGPRFVFADPPLDRLPVLRI